MTVKRQDFKRITLAKRFRGKIYIIYFTIAEEDLYAYCTYA